MQARIYRSGVVGLFIDQQTGKVLVGMRSNTKGWQFPQGGVDPGESLQDALYREMREEIGSDQFTILRSTERSYRYDFPPHMTAPIAKKFKGQDMNWFLCAFNAGAQPDLASASDDEFTDLKWITPQEALDTIVEFKRGIYQEAMKYFGLLK